MEPKREMKDKVVSSAADPTRPKANKSTMIAPDIFSRNNRSSSQPRICTFHPPENL